MLQLSNIDVYYGKVHVLKEVSISVEMGELVTLIGANGAGKSTTLKTISGILHPQKGTIHFLGEQISSKSPEQIVQMGIAHCPEGRRVFSDMTIKENLEVGAFTRRDGPGIREDIQAVFDLFPILKERIKLSAGSLSGGEQQMLAIGRAMMSKPKLLMFDEPSLGLAPIMVERVVEVIKKLHARGTTILLVEQNAEVALKLANRAYVLETGKVTLDGPADSLLRNDHVRKAYLGA